MFVESMPRRIKAVLKTEGGSQPGTSNVCLIKWPMSVIQTLDGVMQLLVRIGPCHFGHIFPRKWREMNVPNFSNKLMRRVSASSVVVFFFFGFDIITNSKSHFYTNLYISVPGATFSLSCRSALTKEQVNILFPINSHLSQ